jgi:hypothetical protein
VPLLRPGFRPDRPYQVSFVYLHARPAFAKKGDMQMTLPRMDVPVGVVDWELFVPDDYRADRFGGTAIGAWLVEASAVAGMTETVSVAGESPIVARSGALTESARVNEVVNQGGRGGQTDRESRDQYAAQNAAPSAPSANVQSLQRRAAGVLPVRIDVPRAGTSLRFLKPLVVDEETVVEFRYRKR